MLDDFAYIHDKLFREITAQCCADAARARTVFGISSAVCTQISTLPPSLRDAIAGVPPPGFITFRVPENGWESVLTGTSPISEVMEASGPIPADVSDTVSAMNIDALRVAREILARNLALGCTGFRLSKADGTAIANAPIAALHRAFGTYPAAVFTVIGAQSEDLWRRVARSPLELATAIPILMDKRKWVSQ